MDRKYLLWLGGAVLGVGLCASAYRSLHPDLHDKAPANRSESIPDLRGSALNRESDDAETSQLRDEVALLASQLSALREQMAHTQAQEPAAVIDSGKQAPDLTEQEKRAESTRSWREHMADVAADFQNEGTEPKWSSSTTATLRTALQNDAVLRDAARNIECRSRTCRVEIADDKMGKINKDLPMFAQAVMTDLPNIQADHLDDGHGGSTTVLYLTHEEQPRPSAAR